jgi:drug/metabolite transporter (DMT)-like permease
MTAVALALAAACTFGAMTVAIRAGLGGRGEDAAGAALAMLVPALAVALVAAAIRADFGDAWRFFLAGLLAPGVSQLLFVGAVSEVGASRASAVAGTAPLFALGIAFVFLHEPVHVGLVLGGLAIVAGGGALALERGRPVHLRPRGLVYALGAAVLFAVRDNIVRSLHAHGSPETVAAATLLAGTLVAAAVHRRPPSRSQLRALAPAGLLFGCSYLLLFSAYYHGRVSVVSPLSATETLWGVGLAALFLGSSESLGLGVVIGAAAIVAGGVVIGATAGV